MPAPAKLVQVLGVLGKEETTYSTFVALTTTADGIQLQFENRDYPWVTLDYAEDGDLGPSVGNLGTVKRSGKTGRSVRYEAPTRAKGAGAAYSASVVPSLHRLLKAAGFDAAVTTTASAEKWTYTPTAPGIGYTSLSMELYGRGGGGSPAAERAQLAGVIADWGFEFPNGKPPAHRFTLRGILNADMADAAFPTITYPLTAIDAPLATGIVFTLGNLSANAVVYSGGFALNREIENPRVALTASGGHLGFVPRGRRPELKVVLERTALVGTPYTSATAFDPYKLEESGQTFAWSLQFGTTQYLRWKLSGSTAQVIGIEDRMVNGIACVELTILPYTSTPVANDDLTVVFD